MRNFQKLFFFLCSLSFEGIARPFSISPPSSPWLRAGYEYYCYVENGRMKGSVCVCVLALATIGLRSIIALSWHLMHFWVYSCCVLSLSPCVCVGCTFFPGRMDVFTEANNGCYEPESVSWCSWCPLYGSDILLAQNFAEEHIKKNRFCVILSYFFHVFRVRSCAH